MDKVNLKAIKSITHGNKEFKVWNTSDTESPVDGQVLLIPVVCKKQQTTSKNGKVFTYYAQLGSAFGGIDLTPQTRIKLTVYPVQARSENAQSDILI